MSAISELSAPGGSSATLPLVDPALEPASVRTGDAAAKKAYDTGLAFEDMLVNELAQQMTASVPGLDGSSSDGLGGSADDGLGGTSSDGSSADGSSLGGASLGAYSSLLPQALSSDIMSAGGTGLALQIAQSLDPALASPAAKANPGVTR